MTKYKFKGYTISCCGYHQPDHCVWWEAVDDSGCACFHGTTLREVEFMILDSEWEDKLKAKDREIAELRKGISELLDALQAIYDEECTSYGTGEVYDKWRKVLKGASND